MNIEEYVEKIEDFKVLSFKDNDIIVVRVDLKDMPSFAIKKFKSYIKRELKLFLPDGIKLLIVSNDIELGVLRHE